MAETNNQRAASAGYQLFMLALCVLALGSLAVQSTIKITPDTAIILGYADLFVCVLFFADFIGSLWRAPNRGRYLLTWGWLDLISSIPTVDALRWGRAARVLRIVRVLRGMRASKLVAELILARRAQNTFLAASLVAMVLLIVTSISILHFEADAEGNNIKTGGDALWWGIVTLTTVGYGDRFPVTIEGRMAAAILMVAGVGLFGTFSGFVAAWFISPVAKEEANELVGLRKEIARLSDAVETLSKDQMP